MIDQDGNKLVVGWPTHHIIWIEAAMTLPKRERTAAFKDVAEMTGRTLSAVRCKAYWLGEQRQNDLLRAQARARLGRGARQPLVIAKPLGNSKRLCANLPSDITPISKARLMGCR